MEGRRDVARVLAEGRDLDEWLLAVDIGRYLPQTPRLGMIDKCPSEAGPIIHRIDSDVEEGGLQ